MPALYLHKIAVSAVLNDLSVLEHNDLVGVHERRSAVRDKEDRGAAELFSESRAYLCVGLGVNGGKRVVKHHDGRLFGQHTRNCGALLLTARKGDSPSRPQMCHNPR